VLAEGHILTRRDLEERLNSQAMIVDLIAQERGLWKDIDERRKDAIVGEIAEAHGVREKVGNIFGIYMYTLAKKLLARYDPFIARLQKARLRGVSEFLVVLKGVEDMDEPSSIILSLAKSYKKFLVKALEKYLAEKQEDIAKNT